MRTVAVASVKDSVKKDEGQGQGGTRAQILAHATPRTAPAVPSDLNILYLTEEVSLAAA